MFPDQAESQLETQYLTVGELLGCSGYERAALCKFPPRNKLSIYATALGLFYGRCKEWSLTSFASSHWNTFGNIQICQYCDLCDVNRQTF